MTQSIKQAKRAVRIQAYKGIAIMAGARAVLVPLCSVRDGLDKLAYYFDRKVVNAKLNVHAAQRDLIHANKVAVFKLREQRESECCPEQALKDALEYADQAKHEHLDSVATRRAELTEQINAAEQALSAERRKL